MRQKLLDALPFLDGDTSAYRWVLLQEDLLRAPNTVDAYARGVNDWLAFCHACGLTAVTAGHDTVALYVRCLHVGHHLSAATLHHRMTVVRLYSDWLCEEGLREKILSEGLSGKPAGREKPVLYLFSAGCRGSLTTWRGYIFLTSQDRRKRPV
ncbi:site-specific integrase [Enterobacter sp. 22466]|uniref:site-specific integrase n=1 Tax=Enterobacter sp. 22466 TaxID=3453924 RepID=UPI003F86AEA2